MFLATPALLIPRLKVFSPTPQIPDDALIPVVLVALSFSFSLSTKTGTYVIKTLRQHVTENNNVGNVVTLFPKLYIYCSSKFVWKEILKTIKKKYKLETISSFNHLLCTRIDSIHCFTKVLQIICIYYLEPVYVYKIQTKWKQHYWFTYINGIYNTV